MKKARIFVKWTTRIHIITRIIILIEILILNLIAFKFMSYNNCDDTSFVYFAACTYVDIILKGNT